MDTIKISIIMMLLLVYASESSSITSYVHNDTSKDDQNCFCFEKSGQNIIKVPELMQSSRGLKRLVLFLYKDLNTNQINMYIPSLEKQKFIPDLPYEDTDDFVSISTESMIDVFNKNHDKSLLRETDNIFDKVSRDENSSSNKKISVSEPNLTKTQTDSPITYIKQDPNTNFVHFIPQKSKLETTVSPQIQFIDYHSDSKDNKVLHVTPSLPEINIPDLNLNKQQNESQNNGMQTDPKDMYNLQDPKVDINHVEAQPEEHTENIWEHPHTHYHHNPVFNHQQKPHKSDSYSQNEFSSVPYDPTINLPHNIYEEYSPMNVPEKLYYDHPIYNNQKTNLIKPYPQTPIPSTLYDPSIYLQTPNNIAAYSQINMPHASSYRHKNHQHKKPDFFVNLYPETSIYTDTYHNQKEPIPLNDFTHKQFHSIPTYSPTNMPFLPDSIDIPVSSKDPSFDSTLFLQNGKEIFKQWFREQMKKHKQHKGGYDWKHRVSTKQNFQNKDASIIPQSDLQSEILYDWQLKQAKEFSDDKSERQNKMNNLFSKQYSNDMQYFEHDIPFEKSSVPQKEGQFSKWAIQQLQMFDNFKSNNQEESDPNLLEDSIINILLKNGIRVTNDGRIIDSHGKILNMQDLSLTPIMIGNEFSLENLVKRQGKVFPPQVPYFQAALLTTTHPFKILGVVPLGKTYLPLSNHKRNANEGDSQLNINKNIYVPDIFTKPNNYKVKTSSDKLNEHMISNLNKQKHSIKSNNNRFNTHTFTKYLSNSDNILNELNEEAENVSHFHSLYNRSALSPRRTLPYAVSSRRAFKLGDNKINDIQFKKLENNSVEKDLRTSNIERMFVPKLTFNNPLDISSTRRKLSLDIISEKDEIAKIPDIISKMMDVALKRGSLPENTAVKMVNDGSTHKMLGISGVNKKDSESMKNFQALSSIDISSTKNNVPIRPVGAQLNLKTKLDMPVYKSLLEQSKNVNFNNYKFKTAQNSNIIGSSNIKEAPLIITQEAYSIKPKIKTLSHWPDVNIVPKEMDKSESIPFDVHENIHFYKTNVASIPNSVSQISQWDISSRSGTKPDGTEDNSPNTELEFLIDAEYDDDYGDFRIIGGNAATGSGTPLSNKGRSGYVF